MFTLPQKFENEIIPHSQALDQFYALLVSPSQSCHKQSMYVYLNIAQANTCTYLGDASDHVFNMGADSSDSSQLLLDAEPFLDQESFFVHHADVQGQVGKTALQDTSGPPHGHIAGLHFHSD